MKLKREGKLILAVLVIAASAAFGSAVRSDIYSGRSAKASFEVKDTSKFTTIIGGGVVIEWNQTAAALTVLPASALAPVQQTRIMAIVQLAMHDAVNGITGRYATYLSTDEPPTGASPEAAAIAAAHTTLRSLFQSQSGNLDTMYANSLAAHGLSPADPGVAFGESAAMAILAARAFDHSAQAQYDYTVPGAGNPGVWTRLNNAPALLPGWGQVTPFAIRSGDQFRPDAPPALDSEIYARDYDEIMEIGRSTGSTRTAEQSDIALFWRASPVAIWNPIVTQAIAGRDLDISKTARVLALYSLAGADAAISCWEAKYFYNFWRPMLAIRGGDTDGNNSTAGDVTWSPFLATPPHPEYPSGHSTVSSAMAAVLENEFGKDPGVHFSVTLTNITREWDTFDQAVDEVISARVYSGIHFRNTDEVGAREGRQVAQFVLTHALRPCKGRGSRCS